MKETSGVVGAERHEPEVSACMSGNLVSNHLNTFLYSLDAFIGPNKMEQCHPVIRGSALQKEFSGFRVILELIRVGNGEESIWSLSSWKWQSY